MNQKKFLNLRYELNSQTFIGETYDGMPNIGALNSILDPMRDFQSVFYADINSIRVDEVSNSGKNNSPNKNSGFKFHLEQNLKQKSKDQFFISVFFIFIIFYN